MLQGEEKNHEKLMQTTEQDLFTMRRTKHKILQLFTFIPNNVFSMYAL